MVKPIETITQKSKDLSGYYQVLKKNISWGNVQSAPESMLMTNGVLILNFAIAQDAEAFRVGLNSAGFNLKQTAGGSVFIEGLEAAKFCSEWGGLDQEVTKHLFELSGIPKKEVSAAMQKAPSYWPKEASAAVGQTAGGGQVVMTDQQINHMLNNLHINDATARGVFHNVYREIINTEMGYLNDISLLNSTFQDILGYQNVPGQPLGAPSSEKINQYMKAYQKQNKAGISYLTVEDMTRSIEILTDLQASHKALLKAFTTYPQDEAGQAQFMQNWLDILKQTNALYTEYSQLYDRIGKSVLPPPYDQIFRKPEYNGLQMGSYLIKPVQRIMKYPLLFMELNKSRPQENLVNVASMKENLDQMNEQKRTADFNAAINAAIAETPAMTTYVDFKVEMFIKDKEERKALKRNLRTNQNSLLQALGLPADAGYSIQRTKKKRGVRADFVLKNKEGNGLLYIVVDKKTLSIQELNAGNSDVNLQHIHRLAVALGKPGVVGKIVSKDLQKIIKMNEISINSGQPPYTQGQSEKKMIRSKIENEGRSYTTSLTVDHLKIDCTNNSPEQIQKKFKEVITQGLFVPKLVPQAGIPLPYLAGPVTIDTPIPLLAIKQYEAALNAGMTPAFSAVAKRNVDLYLEDRLELNNDDTQIRVEVPSGSQSISGHQVLERLKRASSDGLMVTLSPQVELELKRYIHALPANDPILNVDLPKNHSHHAVLVNRLLSLGLLPNNEALSAKWLRDEMREDASLNPQPVIINSGNISRDFFVIKATYEELGKELQISDANMKAMRAHVGDVQKPLQNIDLKRLPAKAQLDAAARLAQLGIIANITATIPQGKEIFIQSDSAEHTREMYERYLGQGFLPKIVNQRVQELSKGGFYISVQGDDPKVLLQRIRHCADAGLKVKLSDPQIGMMKQYLQKHSASITIHGHSWGTVRHNIELANKLGIGIGEFTSHAKSVYLDAVATAKENGNDIPSIIITPIQTAKSRFLRSDIVSNDRAKTFDFAKTLLAKGIQISMSGLDDMKKEIEAESKKTRWFGWSKSPTKSAKEARGFLDHNWQQLENTTSQVAQNNATATVISIREQINRITPPVGLRQSPAPSIISARPEVAPSITRPVEQEQRVNFMPGSQAKAAAASIPLSQHHATELSLKSVLARLEKLQKDLKGDLDIGTLAPAAYKAIASNVEMLQRDLRKAEKELAAGGAHPASDMQKYLQAVFNNPRSSFQLREAVSNLLERQKADVTEPKPSRRGPTPSA